MRIIPGTAAAIAIFLAGYFHIFDKSNDGYDNYAFAGDPAYFDYTDTGVTYHK
jgi:hypothetical protein